MGNFGLSLIFKIIIPRTYTYLYFIKSRPHRPTTYPHFSDRNPTNPCHQPTIHSPGEISLSYILLFMCHIPLTGRKPRRRRLAHTRSKKYSGNVICLYSLQSSKYLSLFGSCGYMGQGLLYQLSCKSPTNIAYS